MWNRRQSPIWDLLLTLGISSTNPTYCKPITNAKSVRIQYLRAPQLTAQIRRKLSVKMKPTTVFGLLIADLVSAVDMSPYKAGTGVEEGFATFVEE